MHIYLELEELKKWNKPIQKHRSVTHRTEINTVTDHEFIDAYSWKGLVSFWLGAQVGECITKHLHRVRILCFN